MTLLLGSACGAPKNTRPVDRAGSCHPTPRRVSAPPRSPARTMRCACSVASAGLGVGRGLRVRREQARCILGAWAPKKKSGVTEAGGPLLVMNGYNLGNGLTLKPRGDPAPENYDLV